MERNTLLAIVLSVIVLFTYQKIFVPPKPLKTTNNSQAIENTELNQNYNSPGQIQATTGPDTTIPQEYIKNYEIDSNNQVFYFSNVGGSLHNVEFLKNPAFPVTDILMVNGFNNLIYTGQKIDANSVSFNYRGKGFDLTKTYRKSGSYLLISRLEINNISEISNLENISITALEIDESNYENQNNRENALLEYSVYANNKIFRKGNAVKFSEKNYKSGTGVVEWIGFRDRYHALVIKPEFETKGYEIKADGDRRLNISIQPQFKNFQQGQSITLNFDIYAGPQNPWIMKGYHKNFEKIFAFSNFPIIEWIAKGLFYTIAFFHHLFNSWGISIILISILVYAVTYPLTLQSMISMKKMQEVQPKITALRERYKNDPQKLNTEMIEIYRREKINPFSGCLPFLIQMPFFMALYQILWRAQYFQGQGFLWIKDLSQPDRLINFPFYLPLFGNEFNILPILTGGLMFLQQRISSKNMVVTDEQQAMQQKMMMYILPVMMACMFYRFASSWALYFLIFYSLSTISQWKVSQLSKKKTS